MRQPKHKFHKAGERDESVEKGLENVETRVVEMTMLQSIPSPSRSQDLHSSQFKRKTNDPFDQ
jgi:hypothetical protein